MNLTVTAGIEYLYIIQNTYYTELRKISYIMNYIIGLSKKRQPFLEICANGYIGCVCCEAESAYFNK